LTHRAKVVAAVAAAWGVLTFAGCLRGQQAAAPTAPAGQAPQHQGLADIEQLQVEVDLLDQLNRLNLTRDQAQDLMQAATQIRQRAAASLTGDAKQKADALQALLEQQKGLLLRDDQEVPANLQDQIKQATDAFGQAMDADSKAQVKDGAALLREALSPDQIQIIVGADLAQQRALQMLDHFRHVSQSDFDASASNEAEVQSAQSGNPAVTPQLLLSTWRQARTMSAQAYDEAKEELAAKTAAAYGPRPEEADDMLVSWALDESLVRLLQQKVQYLAPAATGTGAKSAPQG